MRAQHLVPGLLVLAALAAATLSAPLGYTQAATPAGAQPPVKQYRPAKSAQPGDEGEKIFQQNCSRCHTAPEGFPPRVTGTVLRHMRVRANLSAHQEQELLQYLNP